MDGSFFLNPEIKCELEKSKKKRTAENVSNNQLCTKVNAKNRVNGELAAAPLSSSDCLCFVFSFPTFETPEELREISSSSIDSFAYTQCSWRMQTNSSKKRENIIIKKSVTKKSRN
jgi:hypothetical protein